MSNNPVNPVAGDLFVLVDTNELNDGLFSIGDVYEFTMISPHDRDIFHLLNHQDKTPVALFSDRLIPLKSIT
jgi:hypothetical protein